MHGVFVGAFGFWQPCSSDCSAVDAGADCDGTSRHGISALFHALESKQEAVALLLISRSASTGLGTDPEYVESKPIDRAAQYGLIIVVETPRIPGVSPRIKRTCLGIL